MNKTSVENPRLSNDQPVKLFGWHTYLSVLITLIMLGVLIFMIDIKDVWSHVLKCNKLFVLLGGFAHYATYIFRGIRWRRCLIHIPPKAGNAKFALLVFFYNFVDNVVPAKLGDVYGAHLARINCRITRSSALGSMVFIRMVDAWVVLALAVITSLMLFADKLPGIVLWSLLGGGVIALAATSILLVFFLLKRSFPGWIPDKIKDMIQAFHAGMWPRTSEIASITALTFIVWTLETLWIFFLALAFGLRLGAVEAVFITMISMLATAFPLTPSGIGAVDATLFSCMKVLGAASPVAASFTVVNRLIDHWLHIGLGLIVWAVRRPIGLKTWRDVPLEDNSKNSSPVDPLKYSLKQEVVNAS